MPGVARFSMTPSPHQLRAARALLGMQQSELAALAGVALRTLKTLEQGGGSAPSLDKVLDALGRRGVEFGASPDGRTISVAIRVGSAPCGANQSPRAATASTGSAPTAP